MPTFLCMQRSEANPSRPKSGEKPSPADMEKMYAKFNAWKEKFGDKVLDMGGKLGAGKLVTAKSVVDGPMVESKELIGGYMVVEADSLDEAIEIARGVPGLVSAGSSVWVREIHRP